MGVTERKFGELSTGQDVLIYHLENSSGAYVEVTELGAVLVKVCVPDREGVLTDVVLGFDNVKQYEENPFFFGVVVRRSDLLPMRTEITCTAALMGLKRKCGRLQRSPRRSSRLLLQGSARTMRMVFQENLRYL